MIKWNGKDIECIVGDLNNKFGASVRMFIEGEYFCGTTDYGEGYYRFNTADEAINDAVKNMESYIERIAAGKIMENIRKHVEYTMQQAENKRKVGLWLMKLIK